MSRDFLEVFNNINFKSSDRPYFEGVTVERLAATKAGDILRIYIESDHVIAKKLVKDAELNIKKVCFPDRDMEVKIYEHFTLSDLYMPEHLYEEYKDSIEYELCEYRHLYKNIMSDAKFDFSIPGHLTITLPATVLTEEWSGEFESIIDKIFNERFGFKLVVDIVLEERKLEKPVTDLRKMQMKQKVEEIIKASSLNPNKGEELMLAQDAGAEIVADDDTDKPVTKKDISAETSAEESKTTAKAASGNSKTAKKSGSWEGRSKFGKEGFKKRAFKEKNPDVYYGRDTEDEPVPIDSVIGDGRETVIKGQILNVENRPTKRGDLELVMFVVTDFTDSIKVKMFVKEEFKDEVLEKVKPKEVVLVKGIAQVDAYDKEVSISSVITVKKATLEKKKRIDDYPVKRVELHCHTKMSEMDGLSDVEDIVAQAIAFGHKALAVTDHGVVHAFPKAAHALPKGSDFKLIYGVEAYLVDDLTTIINSDDDKDRSLDVGIFDSDYVVFDIETTGFSPKKNAIIEIGAVKVIDGKITDRFSTFINPERPIPFEITKLTSIRDDMVKDAPKIETVLPEFMEFCKGCILVGHNVRFDAGFIKYYCEKLGLDYHYITVDTVIMAQFLLPQLKRYKLDTVAKELGYILEGHHRAVNDAECTADIFLKLGEKAIKRGVTTLSELNDKGRIDEETVKKLHPYHAIILAKNDLGRINLYRLVSKSHTKYFSKNPRIPKSELLKYREGLLLGSACEAGELYQAILEGKSDSEIYNIASFYDYLEIQPNGNNAFMLRSDKYGIESEEDLNDINRRILSLADEQGKLCVATCDVHFLNPEDSIYRSIIQAGKGFDDADNQAPLFLRTTEEMLKEFEYLGLERAEEVVIRNTSKIADMCEYISPVRPDKAPPVIENSDETLRKICYDKAHAIYGPELPEIVEKRLEKELTSIIGNGYAVMYIIAQKLVWKSVEDGYLVGSRGSVGSSFVATMSGITEVNPLSAHYYCSKCHYYDFDSPEVKKYAGRSGCDMPDKVCPNCGEKLIKEGFDIPFETFLGFKGDKEPDIDLNFSGDYQSKAHKYTEVIFGAGQTLRAGTISGVADKTAFGYVKKYFEERGIPKRSCEVDRLVPYCTGVKTTTGQHPGGIVVLPVGEEINTFTPVQKPANDMTTDTITTHFDYHAIDHNLLKLDILGHDDPTMIRKLEDLTGLDATKIPLDDVKVMSLFQGTEALGITPKDIDDTPLGTLGIPEFGTDFAMNMVVEAAPKEFTDLVCISGLSHGTDVWLGNAQDLIRSGTATISTCISTRDDIMTFLINKGLDPALSFNIMERVRKGVVAKGKCAEWPEWEQEMLAHDVPQWYCDSCKKIKYMFPKAHAVAYVMMAWRIGYFKIYYPLAYYAAFFSIRSKNFSYQMMCRGRSVLRGYMQEYRARMDDKDKKNALSAAEQDSYKDMRLVDEMYARGFEFVPIDIYKADARYFQIVDGKLMASFNSIEGMGDQAAENLAIAAKQGKFMSLDDIKTRGKVPQKVIDSMVEMGILDGLPQSNQYSLFDFM